MAFRVRDLFAGAGGWDIAVRRVFDTEADGWEIMPEAIATRQANGLITVGRDVRHVRADEYAYDVDLASPPCPTFSRGGTGSGRLVLHVLLAAIRAISEGRRVSRKALIDATGDERTALVLEPLRVALQGRSMFIAWEQVPSVLPIWEACAAVLRQHGYSTWVGILASERYGVAQVRRRAILIARRDGVRANAPLPAYSQFNQRHPAKLQYGFKRWHSMADALGWGMTDRPYPTLASARTSGGPDREKVGGSGARAVIYREAELGRWRGDYNGVVRLSLHDAAMVQGFPADWEFCGIETRQYAQISNAIPPQLAESILRVFT